MKKIRVTVLLCVFILALAGCQSESEKSEEKKEVNSAIQEIKPASITIQRNYDGDGKLNNYYETEYGKDGNILKNTRFSSDNSIEQYTIYEYDENLNCVKQTIFSSDNSIEQYTVYEYDGDKEVSQITYTSDGTVFAKGEYIYDVNGKRNKYVNEYIDLDTGKACGKDVREYNENGYVNKWEDWFDGEKIMETIYEYDKKNNKVLEKKSFLDTVMYWSEYEYDGKNNIRIKKYNGEGELEYIVTNEYKEDKIIKSTTYYVVNAEKIDGYSEWEYTDL